jgi:UPF0148 protein
MPLEDRELEQISKMLERGGKMLAEHCETCRSPLFKYEGKITCPVCSFRAQQDATQAAERPAPVASRTAQTMQPPTAIERISLDESIAELISNLAAQMSTETDLARIRVQLECIEQGLRIIQLVRGIDFRANTTPR